MGYLYIPENMHLLDGRHLAFPILQMKKMFVHGQQSIYCSTGVRVESTRVIIWLQCLGAVHWGCPVPR